MRVPARHVTSVARATASMATATFLVLFAVQAIAASPEVSEIAEPAPDSLPLNPEDVHMVAAFLDGDGDEHLCTDWEIWAAAPAEPVWQAHCAVGQEKVHIHLGDGQFVNSHAGRSALKHEAAYELRVRFRDDSGIEEEEWSAWRTRSFVTRAPGPQGSEASAWEARPGYLVEVFAKDLRLPVGIAMVPDPGPHPSDPLLYVTELYGTVKVVTRDGSVRDYATGLLNFNPTGAFPGSGEQGVAGIAVDEASGDLFVSLVYEDVASPLSPKPHYPKVVRLHSDERGLSAVGQTTVLDMAGEVQGASHQVSHLMVSPAGELYVHNGDGGEPQSARDLESFRGKILRMTRGGEPLEDNPFYDEGDGVTARDYVFASGFRNPFGGAWRISDSAYYVVENGPATDRLAQVHRGMDYLWAGADETMGFGASYAWIPSHAPVSIDFVEADRFGGSGFPPEAMGRAFVTESGPTYATGPQELGKRIVEFDLAHDGVNRAGPSTLAEYTGTGKATAVGLAAGPDGLYFTDLYKDTDFTSPIDRGAQLLRVRYCGEACPVEPSPEPEAVDDVPPRIRGFRMQRTVFTVRRKSPKAPKAKLGSAFLYSLSEQASVTIRIRSATLGWRARGTCRRRPERGARERCVLPAARGAQGGTLKAPGSPGSSRRPFQGHLDGRWLRDGYYQATIQGRDRSGNVSVEQATHFRVVGAP